jgi:hypothetical protein
MVSYDQSVKYQDIILHMPSVRLFLRKPQILIKAKVFKYQYIFEVNNFWKSRKISSRLVEITW